MTYPIAMNLAGKPVLVVGAGVVATRRTKALIAAGAVVTVIAPAATEELQALAAEGALIWKARGYESTDLDEAWLVHAATDDALVNALVVRDADTQRIWSIRADDASTSSAWTPAATTVQDITIAVTSNRDPRRSVAVRNAIAEQLTIGSLPIRPQRPRDGRVVLIGGGPGDPDLITVRGRQELRKADVVIFDRLAPLELLDYLDLDVELIDAGKSPKHHTLTQDEINTVIIEKAREGKRVVRLKGGDPFVLGRGSEEIQACVKAGVAVEVVPGISSALAGPLAAGIPVTHRGTSAGFIVISGHAIDDVSGLAPVDLTLVVLMGVATLPKLVNELIKHGKAATTPVAIIERAYAADQRVTTGTLETIAERATREQVRNPAIIVIGDVVAVPTFLAADSVNLSVADVVAVTDASIAEFTHPALASR
jgi:uroporphyrin-III C-methyltransferase/precorrin-2 dehydrogenase/sirohydrochlorin ferrochelatase